MEILYTTVIKDGKRVLHYACVSRDLAINFLFISLSPQGLFLCIEAIRHSQGEWLLKC